MYGYIDSNGNKHLLSGQQDIPQYTMEQYTALSVKPDIWICTDYDSSSEYGIDSANVKYDDDTSVKEAIDEQPLDISSSFVLNTAQFSSLTGTCKAFYDRKTKRVWGTLSAGSTENISQTQAYFTIASDYRPSANIANIPMQVRLSDDRILCYFGDITTGGLVRQDLTSASRGIYAYFEYYL